MTDRSNPVFRTTGEILLIGTMATYSSQAEASQGIPQQWRLFLAEHPELKSSSNLYSASPCTSDRKIHYLAGVAHGSSETLFDGEFVRLEAGEYAIVPINEPALLRETWTWLLGSWLDGSGRREKHAPEFERYAGIAEDGTPICPVEIWIPLEPLTSD
jgi:AraC family transcriptional regulator